MDEKKLYPSLPTSVRPSAPPRDDPQGFRLQQICEVKGRLEREREKRASLYKRYRRGVNVCDGVDMALITASLGLGAAGIGLLSTIIAAPVVVGMEAGAVACGITGVAGKFIARRLQAKAKKHDEIRVLAESKLSSINSHIAKALEDNKISDDEFSLVLGEETKFRQEMAGIREKRKRGVGVTEAEKNQLIQQGRSEALLSVRQKLAAADLQ